MRKSFKILFVYCVLILFVGGCATTGNGEKEITAEKFNKVIWLKASSFIEECLDLSPSQILHYKFTSPGTVDFNIHNHGKHGRSYVIKKKGISELDGMVDPAKLKEGYDKGRPQFCMLWRNKSDIFVKVVLEYTITSK